ncbi:MAG: hypothetical protein ABJG68_06770 [Crocinitomicaceae bacterium]
MRKYKVNREPVKLPSKEAMAKYKDFSRLTHEYDTVVKRPKKPLYKDKKMFILIIILALMAVLISRAVAEDDAAAEKEKQQNTEVGE